MMEAEVRPQSVRSYVIRPLYEVLMFKFRNYKHDCMN